MSRKRDKALVTYKTCPHCGGSGQVPCTGREHFQQQSYDWTKSLNGKAVMIPFLSVEREWIEVPGLAIQTILKGGWGAVKVYISVDKAPNWGGFNVQMYGYDEDYDVINGHRLYFISKGWARRKEVILLETIPMEIEEIKQITRQNKGHLLKGVNNDST